MSAYGAIRTSSAKPHGPANARLYPIPPNRSSSSASQNPAARSRAAAAILAIPFDFRAGDSLDANLEAQLHAQFNAEIEAGNTYPQEDALAGAEFAAYFLGADAVLGFFVSIDQLHVLFPASRDGAAVPANGLNLTAAQRSTLRLGGSKLDILPIPQSSAQTGTGGAPVVELADWASTYAFSYYIKPNYPGRSSHLCNAGFVVPPSSRGLGLGSIAGRTFLYYAPRCGYRGSVFNLVYATNEASVRIWERLGFVNVGRIPGAGRLKKGQGDEEEYVDAWVVYGDFAKIGVKEEEEGEKGELRMEGG